MVTHVLWWYDNNWPFSCRKHLLLHVELAKSKPTAARGCREEGATSVTMGTSLTSHASFHNTGMVTCVITVCNQLQNKMQLQCNSHKTIIGNDSTMPRPSPLCRIWWVWLVRTNTVYDHTNQIHWSKAVRLPSVPPWYHPWEHLSPAPWNILSSSQGRWGCHRNHT